MVNSFRNHMIQSRQDNALGTYLLQKNEPEKAVPCFERANLDNPKNSVILNNLGIAYQQSKNAKAAERAYMDAIENLPDYPKPYRNLALLYQLNGRLDEAIQKYQQYLSLVPQDGEAHYNLGLLFLGLDLEEEAAACFQNASNYLWPDTVERAVNLGVGAMIRGDFEDARSHFLQAHELDQGDLTARYYLGIVELSEGNVLNAIEAFEYVLSQDPDFPQAAGNLGVAYLSWGHAEKAALIFGSLCEAHPTNVTYLRNLNLALEDLSRAAENQEANTE